MTHAARGEVGAGAVAGLGSALFIGLVMARIPVAGAGRGSALGVLAGLVPLPPEIAAIVTLAYGAVLGALFGWLHRGVWLEKGAALARGGLYGIGWGVASAPWWPGPS